jgi:hypothetical protein
MMLVMVVMWFRVLTGQKPASARAASGKADTSTETPPAPPKIRFVKLPNVPGRNDDIKRDVFAGWTWKSFQDTAGAKNPNIGPEVPVASSNRAEEVALRRLAKKLKLEAVLWSENPQAFVNDQLVHVGDTITAKDGQHTCEFEVLRILEDSVLIGCEETRLTLKLAQYLDVNP